LFRPVPLILTAGIALQACSPVGPNYATPRIELPASFVDGGSAELRDASRTAWWGAFGDPLLNEIVEIGLAQNLDILTATERIRTARAAMGRFGISEQFEGGVAAEGRRIETPSGTIIEQSGGAADAFFVFDLFGRYTRSRQGAAANLEAVQFDAGTVRLAYLAEVIDAYNSARYFQAAAGITRQAIDSRRQALDLVTRRADAGEATALEQAQARSLLATAEANLPILIGRYEENVFRIATLIAQPAAVVKSRMDPGRGQLRPRGGTVTGVPADVLRNRPDVRAAEREFAVATATVGVADAEALPSLSLSGFIAIGTEDTWSFGPTLFAPVLNQGVLQANRQVAQSNARQAELVWRNSVLNAVEDVQSAMALTRQWQTQVAAFGRAVEASSEVRDLSLRAFDEGATTFLDVIDAERVIVENQLQQAESIRSWTSSYVQLQVATGKGWLVGVDEIYVINRDGRAAATAAAFQ
jgi:multidrug efflux system outer membrane protein